jgi:hypothetical protein
LPKTVWKDEDSRSDLAKGAGLLENRDLDASLV